MGVVNILLYDRVPKDFRLWSKPSCNYIDDTKLVKKEIFNLVLENEKKTLWLLQLMLILFQKFYLIADNVIIVAKIALKNISLIVVLLAVSIIRMLSVTSKES